MWRRAGDAGAFAKFLDLYGKLEGGSLELTLQDAGEGVHGVASLKKFVIRDESALRSLESSASQTSSRGMPTGNGPVDSDAVPVGTAASSSVNTCTTPPAALPYMAEALDRTTSTASAVARSI